MTVEHRSWGIDRGTVTLERAYGEAEGLMGVWLTVDDHSTATALRVTVWAGTAREIAGAIIRMVNGANPDASGGGAP